MTKISWELDGVFCYYRIVVRKKKDEDVFVMKSYFLLLHIELEWRIGVGNKSH
jgi:hypothetical protein